MAQMAFAEHHDMIEAFPADQPINRSAYAFSQGERGDVGRSRMPIDRTRRINISLLLDLKRRGLDAPPRLVIADGALGFWKAAGEVWPRTREQRCWVHKTANVLAKLPKSQQPKAKRALQEIWMAETKAAAELA